MSISARAAAGAACHRAKRPKTEEDWDSRILLSHMQHEMDMIAQGVKPTAFPQRSRASQPTQECAEQCNS